jgi:hypothetical protein
VQPHPRMNRDRSADVWHGEAARVRSRCARTLDADDVPPRDRDLRASGLSPLSAN